ncbi:TRAP transporter small permease [Cryobacterium sp. Y50]|uniref:TRAP transporter small permease n=1 Tax=Cryobacterium sp. Y50 TaxID=2048286 RepID=UPI000CE3E151|nr:TRAP transporter small permease [Cryobacterium sp. Y50]
MTSSVEVPAAVPDFDPNNAQAIEQPDPLSFVTDRVNLWATYVGAIVTIGTTIVIGALLVIGVVMRFGFNSSLDFAIEIPTYLFPWLIAGGVVIAMGRGGHLAVDFFVSKLSRRKRRWLDTGVWLVSTLTLVFLVDVASLLITPFSYQKSTILGWPMIGSYSAFIYMAISLAVQSAGRLWTAFRGTHHQEEIND